MTHAEFNFHILWSLIQRVATQCVDWYNDLVFATGADFFYLSCITVFMFVRHVLRPILGYSMSAGSSDSVKQKRMGNKSGSFIKGQKYLE